MSNSTKKIQSVSVQCDKIKEYNNLSLLMNVFGEHLNILENTSSSALSSGSRSPILESKDIFETFILKSSNSQHSTPNIVSNKIELF